MLNKFVPICGLLICLIVLGCSQTQEVIKQVVKPPEVSISSFNYTGINESHADFVINLRVKNPNPVGINFSGLEYKIDLAGKQLASGRNDNGVKIAASGESPVAVPVQVAYQDLIAIYDSTKGQDQVPYMVSCQVDIQTPIGKVPVPIAMSGNLPVIRPPKIAEVSLKVRKLTLLGVQMDLYLKIFNPNAFKLDISSADYSLYMQGSNFGTGSVTPSSIPAKDTGTITAPISLNFSGMAGAAYALLNKGSADYQLDYSAKYSIANLPLTVKESKSGTLKINR
jgi:LEA14-like dessication related protein